MKEFIIKNGILVDKQNGLHAVQKDVYVKDGVIQEIAENLEKPGAEVIDVKGQYVSAGFIDVHVHNNLKPQPGRKTEPSPLASIDEIGVDRGATTVVECGSVCLNDIDEFCQWSDAARTRYYGLLSGHGEEGFGTLGSQDVRQIHPEHYYEAVKNHPGYIVGMKVANSNTITNDRGYGLTKLAKEIAVGLGMPLMIHVGNFPPDPNGLVEFLDKGDIVTHTYHGKEVSLFKPDGTPKDAFVRARERGVLFDVGHGSASFNWNVYDRARRKGFLPDLISTDIRAANIHGPVYSLATVMSKIMAFGDMSLEDVVHCNTYVAAKAIQKEGLGELKVGALADFTIYTVDDCDLELVDCYYNYQPVKKMINPTSVIVSKTENSEQYPVLAGNPAKE